MSDNSAKPTPPESWECCGGDCCPCVWDRYYDELAEWRARQAEVAEKKSQTA